MRERQLPGMWRQGRGRQDTEGHFGEPHRLLHRPYSCHRLFPGEEGCGGRAGGLDQVSGHLCSNGAFRLKEINPQASYVLEKNPEYIDADTVKLDGVNIVFIESAEAALSAYNAGEVDVVDNTIIQTQAQSQYGGSDELKSYDLIGTCYYDFNCEKDYLSDARVRKALAMSLNRDVINQSIVASRRNHPMLLCLTAFPMSSGEDYRTTVGNLFTEDVEAAKRLWKKQDIRAERDTPH